MYIRQCIVYILYVCFKPADMIILFQLRGNFFFFLVAEQMHEKLVRVLPFYDFNNTP